MMLGPGPTPFCLPGDNQDHQDEGKEYDEGIEADGGESEFTTSCSIISEHASKHASVAALLGHTFEGTPFLLARAFSDVTYAPLTSLNPREYPVSKMQKGFRR